MMNPLSQHKNQSYQGLLITLFFGFIVFNCQTILANEIERKYPPYPDVWGFEMPMILNETTYPISLFKLPDGDILVTYPTEMKQPIFKFAGQSFFSGHKWNSGVEDLMNSLPRATGVLGFSKQMYPIKFSDGTILSQVSNNQINGCFDHITEAFVLIGNDGREIWKKKLIHIIQNPVPETRDRRCEIAPVTFTRRLETHLWEVVPLQDDTFIIVSGIHDTRFVFRFDKSLHTLYPINSNEWVIVDAVEWDKKAITFEGDYQSIIDAQFNYLKSKIE